VGVVGCLAWGVGGVWGGSAGVPAGLGRLGVGGFVWRLWVSFARGVGFWGAVAGGRGGRWGDGGGVCLWLVGRVVTVPCCGVGWVGRAGGVGGVGWG